MSLAEFKGSPNTPEIFKAMIGDTVKACFLDVEGRVWILMTCGHAVVFAKENGGTPAYWRELPDSVAKVVMERTAMVKKKIDEAKALAAGIDV